jgi:Flp pilus assembly protein TadB
VPSRGFHIHWAWVPAAIFFTVAAVVRYGWIVSLLLVLAGLGLAVYAERRARRRRRREAEP